LNKLQRRMHQPLFTETKFMSTEVIFSKQKNSKLRRFI